MPAIFALEKGQKFSFVSTLSEVLLRFARERRVICTLVYGVSELEGHLGLVLALGGRLHRHNVF